MKELLTHSRQDCFKTCRKKHQFAYEYNIRRATDAKALRMGSAHHDAIEALGLGLGLETAVERIRARYDAMPEMYNENEWAYECETLIRLACGYEWRWREDGLTYLAVEQLFQLPLINPATGAKTTSFNLAGKIDGIIQLADQRKAVKESKLLGDDIGHDADLWRRMRIDHQVSLYVVAARQLGYQVDCVLYDVTRKPTIKPTEVPILDELGAKIVLSEFGSRVKTEKGSWRQTGDKDKGFVLQTRPMTAEEWGEKLIADIQARPDFYFARVEVPRLDQDLREYQEELWDIQLTIREAQRAGRWYRTSNKQTCDWCAFFDLCVNRTWSPGEPLPDGFVQVVDKHPELFQELRNEQHVNGHSPATTEAATSGSATEQCQGSHESAYA